MSFHPLDCAREAKRLAQLINQATTKSVRSALRDRAKDFKVLAEGGTLTPVRMRELEPSDAAPATATDRSTDWSSDWSDSD
jgi:hypothetical protein